MPTYPLTGSAAAVKEARLGSGVRLGQTRLGFCRHYTMISINGVDASPYVKNGSVNLTMRRRQAWTLTFQLTPKNTVTVAEGMTVIYGSGSITNRWFTGTITKVTEEWPEPQAGLKFLTVECTGPQRQFNRRRASVLYGPSYGTTLDVRTIAQAIVSQFTSGFSTAMAWNLGAITSDFSVDFEKPDDAMRKLADLVGAEYLIDQWNTVRLFLTVDTAPSPHTITDSSKDYRNFKYGRDISQTITRIYAFSSMPLKVTGNTPCSGDTITKVPLDTIADFFVQGVPIAWFGYFPRLRSSWGWNTTGDPNYVPGNGSTVTAAAAAGNTILGVQKCQLFEPSATDGGWVRVGSQVIRYHNKSASSGAGNLTGIPASGNGAITADIEVGATAVVEPYVNINAYTPTQPTIRVGDEFVLYDFEDDAAAQAVIAGIEGGDGIYEDVIRVQTRDIPTLVSAALAQLSKVSGIDDGVTFETTDPNVIPGRTVTFSITNPRTLSATFKVETVSIIPETLEFAVTNLGMPPWRRVTAGLQSVSLTQLFRRTLAPPVR